MPLEGFKLPSPRDILAGPGQEEEKKQTQPVPPVEPPEYFEGYQKMLGSMTELSKGAMERQKAAQQNLKEYERAPFIAYTATLGLASVGRWRRNYEAQLEVAKQELDFATQEFSRFSWRSNVLVALPYMMADPDTPMDSVEDVYSQFPNELLLDADRNWLQSVFDRLSYMRPGQLPKEFTGDVSEVRTNLLDTILTEPPEGLRAVHNLTVEELQKSFQPISAELPSGLTAEDVRNILTDLEFDEQTQEEIDSIQNVVSELRKDWIEQSAYVTLVRDGVLNAEAPDLTNWEFTKMLFTQPAMATMELLDKYFNMLPRPLAAQAIMAFPSLTEDSAGARLEANYNKLRAEGMGAWEAASEAFQTWDANQWLKFYVEGAFDPTSYVGFGMATKVGTTVDKVILRALQRGAESKALSALEKTSKFWTTVPTKGPYLGRFAGAIESGWNEMWEVPFRGLRRAITSIPQTPTQKAISYGRQAFMDTRAYLRRFTGVEMKGMTIPQMRDAIDNAIQQAMARPKETGDLSVRVGRYFTDYDFITQDISRDWIRVVGGEGANITPQVTHNINMDFDLFHRGSMSSSEAATNMLASMGVEAAEKNVGKLANTIDRYSKKIVEDGLGLVKGDSAHDVLSGLIHHVEDMQIRKTLSAEYKFAQQVGRSTSWTSRIGQAIDSLTRNSILTKIDQIVTAPMANQYLLFTNYGPFNILESAMRSFLGGGELLYPKAASPVDELVRAGEGLTNLPYEFITAQRDLGRLEIAVIDPKTNKTQVFNKGKIPGITKDLPIGAKINIGGHEYPIRSWQNWNDMFGDIGTKQRANYLLTKYKQYLTELGGDQVAAISQVFEKHQHFLDGITSISKGDKDGLIRSMMMDATVGPDMVLKHMIPLSQLERRKALRTINKVLDKCTDVYSPHKQAIRDAILDGTAWGNVDNFMDGIKESVREFNIISLQQEARALDNLVTSFKDFAPLDGDELMRELGFISDMVDGISERVSDVRQITRARAGKLTPKETDDFYRASSQLLGDFLGKSGDDIGQILDGIKAGVRRERTLLDDLVNDISLEENLGAILPTEDIMLEGRKVGSLAVRESDILDAYVVDALEVTEKGLVNKQLLRDIELLVHDKAASLGHNKVAIIAKPEHTAMYKGQGYTLRPGDQPGYQVFIKDAKKPKSSIKLTEQQLQQLDTLTESIRIRHANAVATRDLDRKIINEAVDATPKKKRTKEWWNWLENKRSQEAWEPYWKLEEDLFGQVEDAKLGMMNSMGVDVSIPPVPTISDKLAPAHVAYLMGVTGDDMYKALTKMGAMTTIRPKNRFVAWVYRRANKAGQKFGKTAEEVGFDKEAIGDVYDQLFRNVGIDPNFAVKEPMTPTMLQLEDVRQELIRAEGTKKITDMDYVKYQEYIRNVAKDLEDSGIHNTEWTDIREQAMMKAREQYEMDFTDYSHRNMVDAAMRMIYPFWTYEWQRWFWLPRAMVKTPGVATGLGRYQEYSDSGYIPIPGTDIQFNPLRGTVFMGGFRRLMLRDYPEYYDAFPGMEAIDFISRVGFYPGTHIMLPIIITGAATGKPEWTELLPGWAKTGLDAARAVAPEAAGKVIDHVFPDRFRDYLTMLTLGSWGYDADEIWRKRKQDMKLTPEEEKLWLKAEASATGLMGILFEQTGSFRLRPPEYTQYMEDSKKLIEEMTGVPADVQDVIQRRYPVTGKRLQDYYSLDALQQKVIYEREQYKRWQGITTPMYPSSWQEEDIRVREFYERVEQLYDDYRSNGIFNEQGDQLSLSVDEMTRQFISGQIGPDQWTSSTGDLKTQASAAAREMGMRDYPDVPKTLDEREERYKERGLPAPTYSPDQEMLYLYYDLKPELAYNWESDRMEYDYDTYFAKIDAILDTLEGEYKQRLLDRIQYNWNGMEKLYWGVSREFLRPYRLVKGLVLEQYSDEQVQALRRYEVARGAEREELKNLPGPEGQKLISGFQSKVREARQKLRYLDPELDAWLYFFGITDSFITKAGEERWNEIKKEYMKSELAD